MLCVGVYIRTKNNKKEYTKDMEIIFNLKMKLGFS